MGRLAKLPGELAAICIKNPILGQHLFLSDQLTPDQQAVAAELAELRSEKAPLVILEMSLITRLT